MPIARPLAGLPAYGPRALSFPRPDAHSEGYVVEFTTASGDKWVGNFAEYGDRSASSVFAELGSRAILVVAGSAGYIVDVEERRLVREIGFDLDPIWFDPGLQAFVASNGLWFEAFDGERVLWRSRRLSWDGIRNLARTERFVTGEAWNPMSEAWRPFRLDLSNGEVEGGSYDGPDR
jgi:hypothetical protein